MCELAKTTSKLVLEANAGILPAYTRSTLALGAATQLSLDDTP